MTCHADLSVDEVVLDLYLLPFHGLSVNIVGLKFMPRFLHTSINSWWLVGNVIWSAMTTKCLLNSCYFLSWMADSLMSSPPWYYYMYLEKSRYYLLFKRTHILSLNLFVCFFFYKMWKVNIQIAINLPVELNLNNFCEFSIKFWLHYVIRVHTAKNAVQYWI